MRKLLFAAATAALVLAPVSMANAHVFQYPETNWQVQHNRMCHTGITDPRILKKCRYIHRNIYDYRNDYGYNVREPYLNFYLGLPFDNDRFRGHHRYDDGDHKQWQQHRMWQQEDNDR
jgi:hypothetical protein